MQQVNFGTTAAPDMRSGVESAAVPMALAPTITNFPLPPGAPGGTLTVNFDTPVGRSQNVALVLGSTMVSLPGRLPTGPPTSQSFTFTLPSDIAPGTVLVRLRVDGVESALTYDSASQQYTQPTVTIT